MASSTVENYLKGIYVLQFEQGAGETVSMGELASSLKVTPGTATSMVKSLSKSSLVEYLPRIGVQLTDEGQKLALLVLRRHRLIEQFLVQALGMEWHEIHDEAEALEHAVSDRLLERIDAYLGHPEHDPHGDPIPSATGVLPPRELTRLDRCQPGQIASIGRIEDQEENFLQYLESNALTPGRALTIGARDEQAGVISVIFNDGVERQLGFNAARKIQVVVGPEAS